MVDCYLYYESELERLNFLDFDDLLVRGVELLTKNRDIANKFEHVLVDEVTDFSRAPPQSDSLLGLGGGAVPRHERTPVRAHQAHGTKARVLDRCR